MPIYHIEVRTPTHVLLAERIDLPDHTAARVEAGRTIGELLRDHADEVWADQEWQVEVTNADGLIFYVMHLCAIRSAATIHSV